ncbi:MAG: DUF6064 family protein [Bacteroidota bacterium]
MNDTYINEQLYQFIGNYNAMIFPIQFLFLFLFIISILFLHSKSDYKDQMIIDVLGFTWIWAGFVYYILSFAIVNRFAAYAFGAVFILQGIFFFVELTRKKLQFSLKRSLQGYIAYFFIVYGLIIYPAVSLFYVDSFNETISLTLPGPTVIITFGFLMLTTPNFPRYLLILPSVWSVMGVGLALNYGFYQYYLVLLAAIVANVYLMRRRNEGGFKG